MNKGNCICCGENQTKIGWTYCDSCISDFEDDDDDSFDQEQNEEENHFNDFRTVEIDGEIWFVASDVANLLGYKRANDAVRQHCKDKGTVKRRIPTKQGEQEMLLKNIVHLKLLEWSNKGDR